MNLITVVSISDVCIDVCVPMLPHSVGLHGTTYLMDYASRVPQMN